MTQDGVDEENRLDGDEFVVLSKSERRRRRRADQDPCAGETAEETRARRTARIKQLAKDAGFSRVGIATATALGTDEAWLRAWLEQGRHATMGWLAEDVDRRVDPRRLVPGARSVLMLAVEYDTAHPRTAEVDLRGENRAWISRYAWGTDYHVVVERRLKQWTEAVTQEFGQELGVAFRAPDVRQGPFRAVRDFRWYVDHGPVLERAWAVRAGLGWRGKHSLVLHPRHGSFFFLACVVTTLDLDVDQPIADHCGSCTACLDACPAQAIVAPYVVDAGLCISHTTIETPGVIPAEQRARVGDHLFGCDICQDVCPFNRFSQPSGEEAFEPRPGHLAPRLEDIAALDPETFARQFAQSAVKRRGLDGLQDNGRAVAEGRKGQQDPGILSRPTEQERTRGREQPQRGEGHESQDEAGRHPSAHEPEGMKERRTDGKRNGAQGENDEGGEE
jgi:epoxyqueuosine reductase